MAAAARSQPMLVNTPLSSRRIIVGTPLGISQHAQQRMALLAPALLGAAQLGAAAPRRRSLLVVRAAAEVASPFAKPGVQRLSLELPTADFQDKVVLTALRRRRGGTAILVDEVEAGSKAFEAGVRPGQQLLAISDPIRVTELWELNGLASLKIVRQTISARAVDTINLRVSAQPIPEWQQAAEAARVVAAGAGPEAEKRELKSQLERMQEEAEQRKLATRMEKVERRKEYQEQVQGQSESANKSFFLAFFSLFILLPVTILLIALGTGYLDSMGASWSR